MDQKKEAEVKYGPFRLEVRVQLIRILLPFCFMAWIPYNSIKAGKFPTSYKTNKKQNAQMAFQVRSNVVVMYLTAAQAAAKLLPAIRITV